MVEGVGEPRCVECDAPLIRGVIAPTTLPQLMIIALWPDGDDGSGRVCSLACSVARVEKLWGALPNEDEG